MKLSIVVAMAENRVIGVDNTLPWHLPEDLKRFKALTMGHPMIMGRLTYDSIGRPLPGRTTIVVTRNAHWPAPEGVLVANNIECALVIAEQEAERLGVDTTMVVGGANIYQQLLPRCTALHVTEVHTSVEGDAVFPEIDLAVWQERSRKKILSKSDDPLYFSIVEYRKLARA